MTKQNDNKPKTPEEISAYMSKLGKKAAAKNKQKGSDYFRWVVSHRTYKKKADKEKEQ